MHLIGTCPYLPSGWLTDVLPTEVVRRAQFRSTGVEVPQSRCEILSVPADGDCLFTSLGVEFQRLLLIDAAIGREFLGSFVRTEFLLSVAKADDDGLSMYDIPIRLIFEAASGLNWCDYLSAMQGFAVRRNLTWGGFAEALWLCEEKGVKLEIYEQDLDAFRLVCSSDDVGAPHGAVTIVWTGSHYDVLTITAAAR